jgi:hypothetical protein
MEETARKGKESKKAGKNEGKKECKKESALIAVAACRVPLAQLRKAPSCRMPCCTRKSSTKLRLKSCRGRCLKSKRRPPLRLRPSSKDWRVRATALVPAALQRSIGAGQISCVESEATEVLSKHKALSQLLIKSTTAPPSAEQLATPSSQ